MRINTEGHRYELENFEDKESQGQILQFIEKKQKALGYDGELETVNDGTTNEEVLAMLINRMSFLQNKFPCRENAIVITKLEESLMWLEKRTADRKARGVEGMHIK
jgi:uncharacterized protein YihD (DUF1040 family)